MAIQQRDGQKYLHDYLVHTTGKVFHFQGDDRGPLPTSVKQHDMISKHVGKNAVRLRSMADQELAAGHDQTALELYFEAADMFAAAQHPIFENNAEKRFLHGSSIKAYDKVRELAPYPIEHLEIPWGDQTVYANFHLLPDGRTAPCIVFIPGCDMTKEMYPWPLWNQAHKRGMHIISVDGPGQGENNLAGTRLEANNYAGAMSAVLDYLETRDEVDSSKVGLYGMSFGSLWSFQASAADSRWKAVANVWASMADKRHIANEESPRYKWLFGYLTQARSEQELDQILADMAVDDLAGQITVPSLITVGEYDPRSPVSEIQAIYDKMTCPRELHIYEDQHHMCTPTGRAGGGRGGWNRDTFSWMLDWLKDRIEDKPITRSGEITYIVPSGSGANGTGAKPGRTWMDAYGVEQPS